MKVETVIDCLTVWAIVYISRASAVSSNEYCQWETFRPRCLAGETIIISKAIYGRMSDTGRCLHDEAELPTLRDDPQYMGCFEDVLHLVNAKCSGRPGCEIRIPDPEMEKTNPCYRHMAKYLEVSYHCIKVVQPGRSCQVDINSEQKFLLPSPPNNGSTNGDSVICGSRERPWMLEARAGQRINISLLDFSGSVSPARTAETSSSSSGCLRQLGYIEDKSANRNINICTDDAHTKPTLYLSLTNEVAVVLLRDQQTTENFLIKVRAVGCSDLVPPSDAWLKRSDNVATVGCYMTRQTWILTCDQTGTWTGTFGNCTQQLLAIQDSSDVIIRPAESNQQTSVDVKVIILVAIIGVSSLVCIIIICVGVSWICRLREKKSRDHGYGGDDLLTSLDVKSTAHQSVGFE